MCAPPHHSSPTMQLLHAETHRKGWGGALRAALTGLLAFLVVS